MKCKQAEKGEIKELTLHSSSWNMEIYSHIANSQLLQTRSPYDDLKTVAKWK